MPLPVEPALGDKWLGLGVTATQIVDTCARDALLHKSIPADIADIAKREVHATALLVQAGLLTRRAVQARQAASDSKMPQPFHDVNDHDDGA